nr:hypothetical protein Iba_chr06cCG5460 [Ipomoea batatas]GMD14548.1 hypothetical protein Iba_chr07bCG7470 [Ipomoea batatas]GMD20937.1 hypothetical protein Iba_chr07fCG9380 [Ipomoea batatas]GMD94675.1 hypothetical protein Iba_chr15aCG4820 [Ipomoea batatas]
MRVVILDVRGSYCSGLGHNLPAFTWRDQSCRWFRSSAGFVCGRSSWHFWHLRGGVDSGVDSS